MVSVQVQVLPFGRGPEEATGVLGWEEKLQSPQWHLGALCLFFSSTVARSQLHCDSPQSHIFPRIPGPGRPFSPPSPAGPVTPCRHFLLSLFVYMFPFLTRLCLPSSKSHSSFYPHNLDQKLARGLYLALVVKMLSGGDLSLGLAIHNIYDFQQVIKLF